MDGLLSGFVGLGESLAKPFTNLINQQGQLTPAARPINPSTFSFDFGGAAQKLLDVFKPKKTTPPIADAAQSALGGIIGAAGKRIEDLFRSGNQQPSSAETQIQNTYTADANTRPSQTTLDLASVLNFLGSANAKAGAASTDASEIATAAVKNTQTNVLLVGGAAVLLVLLMTQNRGTK